MPDRLPPTDPDVEPRRRRRATPRPCAPDAEALALVERAAGIAEGLALLQRAPLECVAVLLRVDPRAVERVRVALEDPALLEEAALRFARAADRHAGKAPASAPPRAPRDAEGLLAATRGREGGLAVLLEAAPECAAIVFGVHPDVVHRARELAARGVPGPGAVPAR